jgi:site-specific recombinase XerD
LTATAAATITISESFLNFIQTCKTAKTKSNYINALKYYMRFSKVSDYDDLLTNIDTKDIQRNIIMFIEYCKQRNLAYSTIKGYVAGIKHWYESNDIEGLKWRKIKAHQPAKSKAVDDKAYTHEQIKRMTDISNLRDKAIILLMASSGMRVDAVHPLKMKDLTPINYGDISLYEVRVYLLSNDEYRGYCSPESKKP